MPDVETAPPGVIGEYAWTPIHGSQPIELAPMELTPIDLRPIETGASSVVPAPGPLAMAGVAMVLIFGKRSRRVFRRR